jgi:fructosamine-3-kinase
MHVLNVNRKAPEMGTKSLHLVASKNRTRPNVSTVPKTKFVAKCDREAWADVWLNKRAGLMLLTRRNKGLGQLAIEDALIDEVNERLRRADRLIKGEIYRRVVGGVGIAA